MKVATIVISIIGIIFSSCGSSTTEKTPVQSQTVQENVSVTFDIPSLIGKNIDQIESILGKPTNDTEPTKIQLQNGIEEWDKTFTKDGFDLLVTYYTKDRTVKDFFLSPEIGSKIEDFKRLFQPGNLDENSTDYIIKPVYTRVEKECTGIIITSSKY